METIITNIIAGVNARSLRRIENIEKEIKKQEMLKYREQILMKNFDENIENIVSVIERCGFRLNDKLDKIITTVLTSNDSILGKIEVNTIATSYRILKYDWRNSSEKRSTQLYQKSEKLCQKIEKLLTNKNISVYVNPFSLECDRDGKNRNIIISFTLK